MYLRFGRPATPVVYEEIPETLGAGVDVLREGKDISLVATGHMVWRALEAAESLEREDGVEAEVVNVSIIKPLDSAPASSSRSSKTGVAVTAEEHRVAGGLADAVREVAAEQHPVPIFAVGMGDEFGALRHRRGLHGALRAHRPRDRRPRPRGAGAEADRLAARRCSAPSGPRALVGRFELVDGGRGCEAGIAKSLLYPR